MKTKTYADFRKAVVETANVRRNVPYVICAGGLALSNILLMPGMAVRGFWVGAFLGTLIFIRLFKLPRAMGTLYLFTTGIWAFMMHTTGAIAVIQSGIGG